MGLRPTGLHGYWSGLEEGQGGTGIDQYGIVYRIVDGIWGGGSGGNQRGVPNDVKEAVLEMRTDTDLLAFPSFPPAPAALPLNDKGEPEAEGETRERWLRACQITRGAASAKRGEGDGPTPADAAVAITELWHAYADVPLLAGGKVLGKKRSVTGVAQVFNNQPCPERVDFNDGEPEPHLSLDTIDPERFVKVFQGAPKFVKGDKNNPLIVLDTFSGIGAALAGMLKAGLYISRYVHVDTCPKARSAALCHLKKLTMRYADQFPSEAWEGAFDFEPDMNNVTADRVWDFCGEPDVVVGGFPCQGMSGAPDFPGKGFEDPRSKLGVNLIELIVNMRNRSGGRLKYVVENVNFKVRHKREWAWIVDTLGDGEPLTFDAARLGPCHRVRSYFTNLPKLMPARREDVDLETVLPSGWAPIKRCAPSASDQDRYNIARRKMRKFPTLVNYPDSRSVRNHSALVLRLSTNTEVFPPVEIQELIMGLEPGATAGEGLDDEDRRGLIGNSMSVAAMCHVFASMWLVAPREGTHDHTGEPPLEEGLNGAAEEAWREGLPVGAEAMDFAEAGNVTSGWFPDGDRKLNIDAWRRRGTSGRLLKDLDEIDFVLTGKVEVNHNLPNLPSCTDNLETIVEEIDKLSKKRCVEWQDELFPDMDGTVPLEEFAIIICPWGTTPKPDGSLRPYIDPSRPGANECMAGWGMKFPSLEHALQAAPEGGCLAKRDWASGFHHCLLTQESRRYTAFRHPVSGRVGRFRVAPFGISQCPGRFWEIANEFLRIAAEELNARGIDGVTLVGYVDDVLIMGGTHEEIRAAFQVLDELGAELGVEWKKEKDEGRDEALQRITFVGLDIDVTGEPVLAINEQKKERYGAQLEKVRHALRTEGKVERSDVRTLVGQLAFAARACRWGRVNLGALYIWQETGTSRWLYPPEKEGEENLDFWSFLLNKDSSAWEGKTRFATARWDLVKGANYFEQGGDAAGEEHLGWGAQWGFERAAGDFIGDERDYHIAWKELIAVLRGFQLWKDNYKGQRLVVWSDNMSVVAAINSGTTGDATGRAVLKELIEEVVKAGVDIRAKHIAGSLNVTADDLSRKKTSPTSSDYKLAHWAYARAWRDGLLPDQDLYCDAAGRNAQTMKDNGYGTRYFSAQNEASVSDISGRTSWFNPPWALAGQALEKVEKAWRKDPWGTHAVGVVPAWEGRWWWSRFIGRRKSPFKVIATFEQKTNGLFLKTGSSAFRVQGKEPEPAGPTPFALVMVEIGGPQSQRGGEANTTTGGAGGRDGGAGKRKHGSTALQMRNKRPKKPGA